MGTRGGNADGGCAKGHAVVADAADVLPGGRGGKQGMITASENLFDFHIYAPLRYSLPYYSDFSVFLQEFCVKILDSALKLC